MDFSLPPDTDRLRVEAEAVAAVAARRYGRTADSWINGYSRAFSRELGARGWIGMTWPEHVGGGGYSDLDRFVVTEALLRAGAPVAAHWFADRQIGPSLLTFGTSEQQHRFLPGIIAGETGWCIGMSEPEAGSDLASLRTVARRRGADYVIDGQKIWTSFAAQADYCYLICRTGSHREGHRGISEIIVPMSSPGVTVRPIRDLAGRDHFCEVWFDSVAVPADHLVGTEGSAFAQTMRQLEHERGGIDRLLSNFVLYQLAVGLAERSHPLVRQEIAALEAGYRIGRLMVLRQMMRQAPAGFSAATKTFCTEHEQRVAAFAFRTLGAAGTLANPDSSSAAYSAAYTIMGGTSEVLRTVIAERLLGLPHP